MFSRALLRLLSADYYRYGARWGLISGDAFPGRQGGLWIGDLSVVMSAA